MLLCESGFFSLFGFIPRLLYGCFLMVKTRLYCYMSTYYSNFDKNNLHGNVKQKQVD